MAEDVSYRVAQGTDQSTTESGSITSTITGSVESAAEELVNETSQCVGHYPFSSVAVAFGGGVLIGWLITRGAKIGSNHARRRVRRKVRSE